MNPAFAPDGKLIIFTSESDNSRKQALVLLNLADNSKRVLDEGSIPPWYKSRLLGVAFTDMPPVVPEGDRFASADGAYTIVLKPRKPGPSEGNVSDEQDAFLQTGKNRALNPFKDMPGFGSFWFVQTMKGTPYPPIQQPRLAVFNGNHNSTDGTEFYVLDLAAKRVVKLSTNGGSLYPWPDHPGFFADSSSRYEDLGDGRTVNCNYLDLYNAKLERTRFGHTLGQFHGTSILVKREKPFNIVDVDYTK